MTDPQKAEPSEWVVPDNGFMYKASSTKTPSDTHSCSYFCTRPECVKAQRDELRDKYFKAVALLQECKYALDYASDVTKPEGLSGCDCLICTTLTKLDVFK